MLLRRSISWYVASRSTQLEPSIFWKIWLYILLLITITYKYVCNVTFLDTTRYTSQPNNSTDNKHTHSRIWLTSTSLHHIVLKALLLWKWYVTYLTSSKQFDTGYIYIYMSDSKSKSNHQWIQMMKALPNHQPSSCPVVSLDESRWQSTPDIPTLNDNTTDSKQVCRSFTFGTNSDNRFTSLVVLSNAARVTSFHRIAKSAAFQSISSSGAIINPIHKQSVMMRHSHNMLVVYKWPHHIARNACLKCSNPSRTLEDWLSPTPQMQASEKSQVLFITAEPHHQSHIASSNLWESIFVCRQCNS